MIAARNENSTSSTAAFLSAVRTAMLRQQPYVFTALGNSMKPFIHAGEQLTLLPVDYSQIRIGDVISYVAFGSTNGAFVTHRVLWKNAKCLWIKGDSLSPVSRLRPGIDIEVLGRVESILKSSGKIYRSYAWRNRAAAFCSMLLIPWQKLRGH